MRESKGTRIIAMLAKERGISEEEVRREIQIALDIGMSSSDPEVRAYWQDILQKGVSPTPEGVIEYIVKEITNKSKGM